MAHQSGYNAIYILSRLQAHHCHATDMQSTSPHPTSKIQQQKKDIHTILFVQITHFPPLIYSPPCKMQVLLSSLFSTLKTTCSTRTAGSTGPMLPPPPLSCLESMILNHHLTRLICKEKMQYCFLHTRTANTRDHPSPTS
jgi:hypothetical protein